MFKIDRGSRLAPLGYSLHETPQIFTSETFIAFLNIRRNREVLHKESGRPGLQFPPVSVRFGNQKGVFTEKGGNVSEGDNFPIAAAFRLLLIAAVP